MPPRSAIVVVLLAGLLGCRPDATDADDTDAPAHTDGAHTDVDAHTDALHTDDAGDTAETDAAVDADQDGTPAPEDCDDADATVHPGAEETCDGRDEDCDGVLDDVASPPGWWLDRDADGFGDPDAAFVDCRRPPAFVPAGGPADCDDLDPDARPGAPEAPGDGVDADCDGVDACFADHDADGFGTGPGQPGTTLDCGGFFEAPLDGDCDDGDFRAFPGADEVCGPVDRDCDGVPGDDDDAVDRATFHADVDGDGSGDPDEPVLACALPAGAVDDATDCNDEIATIHPGAPERCDLTDDDCDGLVDDADDDVTDGTTWHRDRDRDRFGSPTEVLVACQPRGEFDVANGSDCDDGLALRNPVAPEIVGNTLDENCDGRLGCFVDADGDGLAGATTGLVGAASCNVPGFSSTVSDCDDTDAAVTRRVFWADLDGDGFGNASQPIATCEPPLYYVGVTGDCNDGNRDVHPGGVERPGDRVDGDCDGRELCWADRDLDRHGGADTVDSPDLRCDALGEATASDDCDDDDGTVHPGAVERLGDGVDGDCDGRELCFRDTDRDGHGVPELVSVADLGCAGAATAPDDCDDADAGVHPGAGERCGPVDDDCDGLVDDADPGLLDAPAWFHDGDGDGLGAGPPDAACAAPPDAVALDGDCDDALPAWGLVCPWDHVAAGDGATCALRTDGDVVCTGLAAPAPDTLLDLDLHGRLACGVGPRGELACWGDAPADDPRRAAPPGVFVAVDVGDAAACALGDDGALACWGALDPAPPGPWTAFAVGTATACAADAAGDVVCWGDGVCTVDLAGAARLDADDGVACRLDAVGRLACDGCADRRAHAAPSEPLLRFRDVAVGPAGACAVTATADVACWGALAGVDAPDPAPARAVAVGAAHACALGVDREVRCWGTDAPGLAPPGP